jgi:parallel beta-helix repeat protein
MTSTHRHSTTGKAVAAGDIDAAIKTLTDKIAALDTKVSGAITVNISQDKELGLIEQRLAALETIPPPVVQPPVIFPWASLNAAIADTPVNGILDATGHTFNERVKITKPITLIGAVVDGKNLGIPQQQGALAFGVDGIILKNVRMTGSSGAGFDSTGFKNATLINCEMDNNIQAGYHITRSSDILFDGCHIHHNNVALTVDPLWEAGGGKTTNSQRINFKNCEVNHNGGPGIWYDINGDGSIVEANNVHHNTHAGIMFEISDTCAIKNNAVWENAWGDNRGWGWQSGILVSSACNATVTGNIVAWNKVGIALVSQNRGDFTKPHAGNSAINNFYATSLGYTTVANYVDWADPVPRPPVSPNTAATAAQLTAAGIPTAPSAGH